MAAADLTAEQLRAHLHYDPETGLFTRRTSVGPWKAGQVAGTLTKDRGYIVINIKHRLMYAHRLAWLYMKDEWPLGEVDHKNLIRHENWFDNLRDLPKKHNIQNVLGPKKNSTTGFLGVFASGKGFRAQIGADGRQQHLGVFETKEDASAAYIAAKRRLHPGCTI